MNIQRTIFSIFMSAAATILFIGCSDNDKNDPSVAEQQIEKLKGSWKATAVTLDDVAQSGYDAFTMGIMPNTAMSVSYTISYSPDRSPWISASGGRLFFDEPNPAIYLIREDEVNIQYAVTDTSLIMEFTYQEEGGRTEGVSGNWKFTFSRQ